MRILETHKLDKQIHSFLDRKSTQFPELDRIGDKVERMRWYERNRGTLSVRMPRLHPSK